MSFDIFQYNVTGVLLYKKTTTGYHAGIVSDPDNVSIASSAQTSGALYINSVVEMSALNVNRGRTREYSGQVIRQILDGGVESVDDLTLTLARMDTVIANLSTGVTTNEENTGWKIGGMDLNATTLNSLGMFVFGNASEYVEGTGYTAGKTFALNYPNIQLAQGGVGFTQGTGDNPNNKTYSITVQSGSVAPTGQSVGSGTNNLALNMQGDLALAIPFLCVKPFHVVTHWAKTGTNTFQLKYLPLYTDATATDRNLITKNGVPSAVTSIAANGTVTITGADNDKWVIMYPTAYVRNSNYVEAS